MHDPLGRRIAKQVNGTTVEKYLWADRTKLLAVYDGNDNLLQRYTYADARMPVSMSAGGATYFLLTDQVGTLRAVADTSGAIVKRIDYDSFGNIINDTNPAFSVPFGFAGGLHDRDTGLVRFGYRDFSPELGRFTAKDPIDFAGGDTNLYAYVFNDPVNWIDPEGLRWWAGAGEVKNRSGNPITVTGDTRGGGEASVVIPPGGSHNFNRDWTGAVCDSVRKRSLDPFRDLLLDPDHVQGPLDKERRKIQPWPWTTIEYESPGSGSW